MFLEKFNKNHWPNIGKFFIDIIIGLGLVCKLICSPSSRKAIRQKLIANHFFKSIHYAIFEAPKIFWKKPSGIEIGRLPLKIWLYAFGNDAYFGKKLPLIASTIKKEKIASMQQRANQRGFTLVEMLVSMTLIANIRVLKNRIVGRVNLYEELYMATENIGDLIKSSGGIDYEEYFNRRILGTSLSGGHYAVLSGFGNYGEG